MKTSESKFSKCLYFTSSALARKVEKMALECWKPSGLSPSHAYLLLMVLEEPGVQPGYISEQLQLSPSTISRLMEKLESKKLIVRMTEGKSSNVYPTNTAKNLLPELKKCLSNFNSSYSDILGKEQSSKLVTDIAKLADQFT